MPRGIFLGGPRRDFETVGRLTFNLLLGEGLAPHHKVLDIGCGALRIGYWLIGFLEAGGYCGLEPNRRMLRTGLERILEPGMEEEKRPRFSHDERFDFTVFPETRFDFVIARSVWTHASKTQIVQMLESFCATAVPGARFLTSYLPAMPVGTAPGGMRTRAVWVRDYKGEEWIGASHRRKEGGMVAHSKRWIRRTCRERGLEVQSLKGEVINRQRWLRIIASR